MSLRQAPVGKLMSVAVKTVEGSDSLEDSIKVMGKNDIGCVIVTEGGSPVGILTERDVLRRVAENPENLRLSMAEVMSRPLVSVNSTATVWDAMEVMGSRRIRHLAVLDNGALVGVLTQRDLLRLFLSNKKLLLSAIGREETRLFMME